MFFSCGRREICIMVAPRKEWIISRNRFWAITLSPNSKDYPAHEHNKTSLPCSFPITEQAVAQSEQLLEHLYEEAALTLFSSEEYNDLPTREQQFLKPLQALTRHLRSTNAELYQHSLHVLDLTQRFLYTLHFPGEFIAQVRIAALFHDLGKLALSAELLQKPTGLTPEEHHEIKKHTTHGAKMLLAIPLLEKSALMVYHHHERWDGNGYPTGLRCTTIPLGARIIAIADAFAVMTSRRPYHEPWSQIEALHELARCSGTQFDPLLVECFISTLNVGHGQERHTGTGAK